MGPSGEAPELESSTRGVPPQKNALTEEGGTPVRKGERGKAYVSAFSSSKLCNPRNGRKKKEKRRNFKVLLFNNRFSDYGATKVSLCFTWTLSTIVVYAPESKLSNLILLYLLYSKSEFE